jgi:hypothetical protein
MYLFIYYTLLKLNEPYKLTLHNFVRMQSRKKIESFDSKASITKKEENLTKREVLRLLTHLNFNMMNYGKKSFV